MSTNKEDKTSLQDYEPKPLELSKKITHDRTKGVPKGKKPWKQSSKRSGIQKKYYPKTWEQKKEERVKIQALRERVKEIEAKKKSDVSCNLTQFEQKAAKSEKLRLKRKLKEIKEREQKSALIKKKKKKQQIKIKL